MLVLGDYGTGKTTLVDRLFWETACEFLKNPSSSRIPILIPLKRYRKEVHLRSLIMDLLLHEYGVRIRDFSVFRTLSDEGRLLLFLDAFDEMASGADEGEVIANFQEIRRLAGPNDNVIMTCRTHFFKDQDQLYRANRGTALYAELELRDGESRLCYLAPFTPEDVKSLVLQYAGRKANEYLDTIEKTYNLRDLATHPILLDMILATAPQVLKNSPVVSASDLYRVYTSLWLDRDDWRSRMTHDEREFFMEELAMFLQLNHQEEIHFRQFPKVIRQQFPGLRTMRELDRFEADVRTCTFLVRDDVGNFRYSHRSFREYFAAKCAVRYFEKKAWPSHLWRGKSHRPTSWITPETAAFALEIMAKKNLIKSMVEAIDALRDGLLILNILRVCLFASDDSFHALFEIVRNYDQTKSLGGIEYRSEIIEIANSALNPRQAER